MSYRVLIIGLGSIGFEYDIHLKENEYFLTHAKAYNYHKKFHLAGAVDKDSKKLQSFKKERRSMISN